MGTESSSKLKNFIDQFMQKPLYPIRIVWVMVSTVLLLYASGVGWIPLIFMIMVSFAIELREFRFNAEENSSNGPSKEASLKKTSPTSQSEQKSPKQAWFEKILASLMVLACAASFSLIFIIALVRYFAFDPFSISAVCLLSLVSYMAVYPVILRTLDAFFKKILSFFEKIMNLFHKNALDNSKQIVNLDIYFLMLTGILLTFIVYLAKDLIFDLKIVFQSSMELLGMSPIWASICFYILSSILLSWFVISVCFSLSKLYDVVRANLSQKLTQHQSFMNQQSKIKSQISTVNQQQKNRIQSPHTPHNMQAVLQNQVLEKKSQDSLLAESLIAVEQKLQQSSLLTISVIDRLSQKIQDQPTVQDSSANLEEAIDYLNQKVSLQGFLQSFKQLLSFVWLSLNDATYKLAYGSRKKEEQDQHESTTQFIIRMIMQVLVIPGMLLIFLITRILPIFAMALGEVLPLSQTQKRSENLLEVVAVATLGSVAESGNQKGSEESSGFQRLVHSMESSVFSWSCTAILCVVHIFTPAISIYSLFFIPAASGLDAWRDKNQNHSKQDTKNDLKRASIMALEYFICAMVISHAESISKLIEAIFNIPHIYKMSLFSCCLLFVGAMCLGARAFISGSDFQDKSATQQNKNKANQTMVTKTCSPKVERQNLTQNENKKTQDKTPANAGSDSHKVLVESQKN